MFSAPIPGQSLTSEPKNSPWENPPEFSKPEDALMWHMSRLEDPKKVKAIVGLLDLGLDVVTMTQGILRGAVAEGRHSVDVSLIIAPIIHEYIVGTADALGIEYEEGLEQEEMDDESIEYSVQERKAQKILADIEKNKEIDLSTMEQPEEPMVEMEEEVMPEEQPMGLMARRAS